MNKFLKIGFAAAAVLLSGLQANAQSLRDYVNKADQAINGKGSKGSQGNNSISNLSNTDIVSALREALQIGAKNSGQKLSAMNGYFGNQLIKILMPPEARQVESTLRNMGLGDQVDKAILSMNRAAEDAATKAVPIFIDAIKGMSIQDGLSILKGGNGAATAYLKQKTTAALTSAFTPVIKSSLDKVNATKYWKDIFTTYNKVPLVKHVNPDLTSYVTERALNGLFVTIADEENKIRVNPAARVTDLLKKVFGAHS
jgi:hypothetical protein